jgi:hypothetical protein
MVGGVLGVDPVAHALGHLLEGVDVAKHGLAALGVELRDAEGLDVALAREAELLLDSELDGKAVTVPACLPVDAVALHGLEPREDVLEDPRLDVVGAGEAVGGRRALVEGPGGAGAAFEDLSKSLSLQREHVVLERGRSTWGGTGRYSLTDSSFTCQPGEGTIPAVGRSRGTTLLGRPSAGRPSREVIAAGSTRPEGRSSGGSGVIFTVADTPGLPPSPGRSWPYRATRPINAVRCRQVCQTVRAGHTPVFGRTAVPM